MVTLPPGRGRRVAEILNGVIVGDFIPTRFQRDSEVARFDLTPLTSGHQVQIARAIHAGVPLELLPNGNLLACQDAPPLARSVERRIRRLIPLTYTVEMRWQKHRLHPAIYVLSPVINQDTRPLNRHLYLDVHPSTDARRLCIYPPHYDLFNAGDDVAQLVIWTAAYLVCDAIQTVTRHWIGPEASHSIRHIEAAHAQSQCWCGSGRPLLHCCGLNHAGFVAAPSRRFTP